MAAVGMAVGAGAGMLSRDISRHVSTSVDSVSSRGWIAMRFSLGGHVDSVDEWLPPFLQV